jgi:hypothetical protein
VNSLLAHVEGYRTFSSTVDKDIVENVLLAMHSGSSVGDDVLDSYPDAPAPDKADTFLPTSICQLKDENGANSYAVTIRKNKQFALTSRIVRAGASFRGSSRILKDIADVLAFLSSLRVFQMRKSPCVPKLLLLWCSSHSRRYAGDMGLFRRL